MSQMPKHFMCRSKLVDLWQCHADIQMLILLQEAYPKLSSAPAQVLMVTLHVCSLHDFPWTSPAHHICSHVLSTSFMIWKLAIIVTCMWLVNQAYSTLKQWMNTLNSLPPFTYEYSTWEVMWAWQSICCGSWHPLHNQLQDTQVLRLTGILGIQNP